MIVGVVTRCIGRTVGYVGVVSECVHVCQVCVCECSVYVCACTVYECLCLCMSVCLCAGYHNWYSLSGFFFYFLEKAAKGGAK